MAQWYFSKGGKQEGPVSIEALLSGAKSGKIAQTDLVWTEGMREWLPAGQVQHFREAFADAPAVIAPAQDQQAENPQPNQLGYQQQFNTGQLLFTERALDMLRQTKPWVRIVSILMFVACGIGAIAILIALIGGVAAMSSGQAGGAQGGIAMVVLAVFWFFAMLLYFIPAMYLARYASRITALLAMRREHLAEQALEAQKSFWKFIGILTVIAICLWLVMLVLSIVVGVAGIGGASSAGSRPRF